MGPDIEWNKSSFDFIYLFTPKPNCFLAKALKEEIHASFTKKLLALSLSDSETVTYIDSFL